MKIEIKCTKTFEIPEGEFCQREDGSINCKQYGYDVDPFFGVQFYCSAFKHYFKVGSDGKLIRDKRNIKKCDACLKYNNK